MSSTEDLAGRVRPILSSAGTILEVKMFGGLCFTLNGNMVVGASKRGLLLRIGKEQHAAALKQPYVRPMEMNGRAMEGYVFVDPPPRSDRALRDWVDLAVRFVTTLPAKSVKSKRAAK